MNGDNLLSIGAFALLSGLSVTALRHYDEVGVLRPASVDPLTGYRRYRPEQVDRARMVCALRGVDLPIEALRDVLDHPDGDRLRTVLAEHRGRLEARARALKAPLSLMCRDGSRARPSSDRVAAYGPAARSEIS